MAMPASNSTFGRAWAARLALRVGFIRRILISQVRDLIWSHQHDHRLSRVKGAVEHSTDVRRSFAGSSDGLRPLDRLQANRPKEREHRPSGWLVAAVHDEYLPLPVIPVRTGFPLLR